MRGLLAGAGLTAAVLLLVIGPQNVLARLTASALPGAASGAGRVELWREALAMLYASPAFGIGLNTFVVVHGSRPEYQGAFVYQGAPHAHNTLLQAALDYGLPGFVAVVGLGVALAWAAWRAHRRLAGTALDAVAIGLIFGLLAHAVHGLVDAVAIGAKIGFVPWALAGALAGLRAGAHRWARAAGR
jgi:O-antigen ligase